MRAKAEEKNLNKFRLLKIADSSFEIEERDWDTVRVRTMGFILSTSYLLLPAVGG